MKTGFRENFYALSHALSHMLSHTLSLSIATSHHSKSSQQWTFRSVAPSMMVVGFWLTLSWAMFFGVSALWRLRSGWGEFSRQQSLLWPPCCALAGVNAMLRKVAGAAAAKPHVEIRQDGEQFYIKTSTSVRTTEINFHIGKEFDEETVDGRKCKVYHEKLT